MLKPADDRPVGTWRLLVGIVLCSGILVRFFSAWLLAVSTSSDHGIPCLMAKHMAENSAWPAFYYGQPYMGSIEPLVSSLFVRLLGAHGFAYNLGTALFGALFLIVMRAWVTRAGGTVAALAALLFLAIGTPNYFQFSSWCYGGYGAILFLSPALLWTADIIIEREKSREAGYRDYFVLGLLAGLSWWTSPLLVAAFLTVAVIFLGSIGLRTFNRRAWTFFPAFFVGGYPFWAWNFTHDWATFRHFSSKMGAVSWSEGLQRYLFELVYRYLAIKDQEWLIVVYLVILSAFVYDTFRVALDNRDSTAFRVRIAAIVMQIALPVLFCTSPYSADRYLTTITGSFALMIGIGTASLHRWVPWGLGWLPVLVLVLNQMTFIPGYWGWRAGAIAHDRNIQQLAEFMRSQNINAVYCNYMSRNAGHGLNAHLHEEFVFTDPRLEGLANYAAQAEHADRLGVLEAYENIDQFLAVGGGSAETDHIQGVQFTHSFVPPPPAHALPSEDIQSIIVSSAPESVDLLLDLDVKSSWHKGVSASESTRIDIELESARLINGLRLFSHNGSGFALTVYGLMSEDGAWHPLVANANQPRYIWSGTRPFYRHLTAPWTVRFEPVNLKAIRLELNQHDPNTPIHLAEIQVLVPGHDQPSLNASLPLMISLLKQLDVNRLFTPRWLANKATGAIDHLKASQIPGLFGDREVLPDRVIWTQNTAIAVDAGDAEATRRVLEERQLPVSEKMVGPWNLFFFAPESWEDEFELDHGLTWTGEQLLKRTGAEWATTAMRRSKVAFDNGEGDKSMFFAREAERVWSNNYAIVRWLGNVHQSRGNHREAVELLARARILEHPKSPGEVLFGRHIKLLGSDYEYTQGPDGSDQIECRYYWLCPPYIKATNFAVFVHIKNASGDIIAQDDHILLDHVDPEAYSLEIPTVVRRAIVLPPEQLGPLTFWVGVYDRNPPHKRLEPKSSLQVRSKAVLIFERP